MTTTNHHDSGAAPWQTMGLRRPAAFDAFDLDAVPDHHRERVEALIPSPLLAPQPDGSGYVMRDVDGESCLDTFALAVELQFNVILSGPTGAAKTLAARAFAAAHRVPFVSLDLNGGVDPSRLWGEVRVDEERRPYWFDSDAALVALYGGVTQVDEVNMTSQRITAALHSILDDRRYATIPERGGQILRASAATAYIGAMNPGYQGTVRLNQALADRFLWPVDWQYDRAVEVKLLTSSTLIDLAWSTRENPEVRSDLSTRDLVMFEDTARHVNAGFAAARLLAHFEPSERGGVGRALELELPTIAAELDTATGPGLSL